MRGQTLLELDPTSLQTRVNEAERTLEAEQLRLDKFKRNYERLKELHEKEFVGEQYYLDAKTDYNLAKLNLEIAQSRLEEAQEDLSKTVILAPHDGVLTLVDLGEWEVISGATSVSNGTELMTIAQLRELYMEANINEVDVERLTDDTDQRHERSETLRERNKLLVGSLHVVAPKIDPDSARRLAERLQRSGSFAQSLTE